MTKNLHLEHPEDTILTGDLSVLDWFSSLSDISVKMDGSVAIVWGINPENGRFFVGKKSVFNKVKVQICYTPQDITGFYGDRDGLCDVLLACLDFLPRTEGIYQGDFIGFGGQSSYTPNTITYDFGERVESAIIICPHTYYVGDTIKECVAEPLVESLESDGNVLFVQPTVDCSTRFVGSIQTLRKRISMFDEFLTVKEAKRCKISINALIREGKKLTHESLTTILGSESLALTYLMVMDIKALMMDAMIVYDGPKAYINGDRIVGEGFVRSNSHGSVKLVDRYQFSMANFNMGRYQAS